MGKQSPTPPAPPDYGQQAQAQGAANIDAARVGAQLNRVNQYTPWGNQIYTPGQSPDSWESTIQLSPDQQQLLDNQTQGELTLSGAANAGLGRVTDTMGTPFDTSGAPSRVTSVAPSQYGMYDGSTGAAQKSLDFSSLGSLPNADQYGQQANQVSDALYHQATSKLDPQYAQQEEQLRSRLLNSGINQGSDAYSQALNDFYRQKEQDYGDARDRSIIGRGQEQSRLLNDSLAARGQGANELTASGEFANQASQQDLDSALKALGFNNATGSQQFSDQVTAGNFQNQQRGASLDEAAFLRNLPLNEYNALISGVQVQNPNFANTPQVASPAAAPVFAGAQAQNQSALDMYNQQVATQNANTQATTGLAGTALSAVAIF